MNTVISSHIVKRFIPSRKLDSRKGDNGIVLVVGGSYIYHGAPTLTSLAAMRSGSDLVYTAVPKIIVNSVRSFSPSLIVIPLVDSKLTRGAVNKLLGNIPKDLDSATIGMGLSISDNTALQLLIKKLLDNDVRLSLDASSLISAVLPLLHNKNVVVTPHTGEFKRLFGVLPPTQLENRISVVQKFANKNSLVILLKGNVDIISNGIQTYINPKKSPSMTIGGSGDVLSGLVVSMLAKNRNTLECAAAAAFINGQAGIVAQKKYGCHILSTDLIDMIPQIMKKYDRINQ